jgi:transaldolase
MTIAGHNALIAPVVLQPFISEGIDVNVTLLFGLPRYEKVAEAHIAGL